MTKKIIFVLVCFFVVDFAFAQGGLDPIDPSAVTAPLDGGLSLLLAAGAAYGAKKVYEFRNKNNENNDNEVE